MSNGRLLILDADPSVLASYTHSLTGAGFEVTPTPTATAALRRIEKDRFEAILTDRLTLLRRLRLHAPAVPVILMLDKPDNRAAIKATELGAVQSLVKPIARKLLVEMASYAVRLFRSQKRILTPHPYRSERPEALSVSATDAKNEFGRILEKAIQGRTVLITKHDAPKAVLISVDEFNALTRAGRVDLDALSGEFDQLLAGMQTPASRAGMKAAFDASPRRLGQAAVRAARKRG
jgi:antitoxin Phd